MSEVKNKKKKSSIIQVSIGVLAVILAILIIIMMGIVSDIQGTARIVNYTGLVRGETQRLIKLELSTQQENEMIREIRTFIDGLRWEIVSVQRRKQMVQLQCSCREWQNNWHICWIPISIWCLPVYMR